MTIRHQPIKIDVFLLTLLTSINLQALSNFCNDYGDWLKGTDENRSGPKRAIHLNLITGQELLGMIVVLASTCIFFGVALLLTALGLEQLTALLIFAGLGLASIVAAIKYTLGEKPYGYIGLGDLSVFFFFGLLNVGGAYYMQLPGEFGAETLLPAVGLGLLSVCVLNVNNLRDEAGDRQSGKNTLVVKLGCEWATIYYILLVVMSVLSFSAYVVIENQTMVQLLLIPAFLILQTVHIRKFRQIKEKSDYNSLLAWLSKSTFIFVLIWSIIFAVPT